MDDDSLEAIYHRFFYCLYGCNEKLRTALDVQLRYSSAYFYEFLTHVPLRFVGADERHVKDAMDEIYLLAPFARRMIEESRVVPDVERPERLEFSSRKSQRHKPMYFAMRNSLMAKELFRRWNGLEPVHRGSGKYLSIHAWSSDDSPLTNQVRPQSFCYGLVEPFVPFKLKYEYESVQIESASRTSLNLLQSLFHVVFPGRIGEDYSIPGIIVPIATRRLFYGCIWITIPTLAENISETMSFKTMHYSSHPVGCYDACARAREDFLGRRGQDDEVYVPGLLGQLMYITHEDYVPVLALQHEQLCEQLLGPKRQPCRLSMIPKADFMPYYRCAFGGAGPESSQGSCHMIEEGLFDLAKKRGEASEDHKKRLDVFKRYMVCSRAMIKLVDNVVRAARAVSGPGTSLPAALIVGGPGTGKESLARIYAAFTHSYAFGTRHTINMAALKPGALVSFAMSGFAFSGGTNATRVGYSIDGILAAVRDTRITQLKKEKNFSSEFEKPLSSTLADTIKSRTDFPMLVLDELNSMDHDSQGVLLRFLENAEVVPIGRTQDPLDDEQGGDLRPVLSNFLVVGMMNEDPDEISREQAMEFVTGSPYLRGFIADLLYEQVLKMRRLRPDIKYRMVRSGKLEIPFLSQRKEDIPILFYVYINADRRQTEQTPEVLHLTLDAVARLVSPDLKWPGNIRQLQALASKVSEIAIGDEKSRADNVCWVELRHIESGIEELGMLPRES